MRRALALAVDRRAIVEKILRGGQLPATTFIPPTLAGYIPPAGLATDFAAARQLLVDAGFPGGSGLPPLELLYNTSDTHRVIAEAVQEMWRRELGVEVRLVNEENASTLAARSTGQLPDSPLLLDGGLCRPGLLPRDLDAREREQFHGLVEPTPRMTRWCARPGSRPPRRRGPSIYRQAEAILLAAAPIIPIYHYTHVYLLAPAVQGWFPTALDHHPYKHVWLKE